MDFEQNFKSLGRTKGQIEVMSEWGGGVRGEFGSVMKTVNIN